jgi:hypothetical protein
MMVLATTGFISEGALRPRRASDVRLTAVVEDGLSRGAATLDAPFV